MFTFIANIPIFRRLLYAFLLAAVAPGIVIGILGVVFLYQQNARGEQVKTNVASVQAANVTSTYLQDLNQQLNTANSAYHGQGQVSDQQMRNALQQALTKVADSSTKFNNGAANYKKNFQLATAPQMSDINTTLQADAPTANLGTSQQQSLTLVLNKLWPNYKLASDQVIKDINGKQSAATVQKDLDVANTQFGALQAEWNKIADIAQAVSMKVAQVGPSQISPIILATIIAVLSTAVIVITVGYIVNQTITRPLRQLAMLTKRIAKGETEARARLAGRDEIYMVANSMNNMLDNIVRLIQEAQTQRDGLQAQVEKLVSEVSGVGEGDLRDGTGGLQLLHRHLVDVFNFARLMFDRCEDGLQRSACFVGHPCS